MEQKKGYQLKLILKTNDKIMDIKNLIHPTLENLSDLTFFSRYLLPWTLIN